MAKDPAVLLYTSDFFVGTATMTNEQVGMYIRLLCLQHQQGHLSEKDMLSICKTYDDDVFRKFKIDDDGLFFNERMEKETNLRKAYSESRKKNASGAKTTKKQTHAKDMKSTCKTYASHMEDEDVIVNEKIIDIDNVDKENGRKKIDLQSERFDQFWSIYPKKVGKTAARKSWSKVSPNKELFSKIISAVETAKQSKQWQKENGQFIPNPTTWLNQGRWDDEHDLSSSSNPFMDRLRRECEQ